MRAGMLRTEKLLIATDGRIGVRNLGGMESWRERSQERDRKQG
jgi:hypothetical protein